VKAVDSMDTVNLQRDGLSDQLSTLFETASKLGKIRKRRGLSFIGIPRELRLPPIEILLAGKITIFSHSAP